MNIKKIFSIKIIFIFFLTSLLIGVNIYYNKSKLRYNVTEFKNDTKIFIDRDYVNLNNNGFFLNKIIVQVPRHHSKNINIFTISKLTIYRPTCSKNINEAYNKDWQIHKIKVKIEGISCTHNIVYFKEFDKFFLTLMPGGTVSADPIFINIAEKRGFFKIINKNLN